MKKQKYRDLTLISFSENKTMVIGCDSCGGVGLKENDVLKVAPYYVGRLTARVGILEVICTGAEVVTVVDAVCNEMESTGTEIIRGIEDELAQAGVDNVILTGSTEENFSTSSTALGLTVIGIVDKKDMRINRVEKNAVVLCIGVPKVGGEINLEYDSEIAGYSDIKNLLASEEVYELIPVGSKGILYEAQNIAEYYNLDLEIKEGTPVDIYKSAGTATCVLAVVKESLLEKIDFTENVSLIAVLK